jgi:hypothetical protein
MRSRTGSTAFIRKRKLSFKDLLVNLMSFTRPGVQTELDRFYKAISKSPASFESISKSAFTQSRKKLRPEAFTELSDEQLTYFKEHAPCQKNWLGKRVVAIDGSLLNLPHTEEIEQSYGSIPNQHEKVVSARCSFAYDVCNELVLSSAIAPRASCEKDLAVGHLGCLNPSTDILLFDRGYPSQWLMGLLMKQGFQFCFRLSTAWKEAYQQVATTDDVNWSMTRRSKKDLGKLRSYNLSSKLDGLRLVAIDLSSGEKEVLVTNLSRTTYGIETLKDLYHMRWGVEESFKTFKKTLHIEHFTGKTVQSVKQDFYARVFMLNMASMLRSQGVGIHAKAFPDKYDRQANKTQTLAKLKDFLPDLFYKSSLRKLVEQLVKIIKKRMDIIRPGRSFPRPQTSSRRRAKIINSKGI